MPTPIIVQAGEPRALSVEQVAETLNCSMDHARRLIVSKAIRAVNLAPRGNKHALYRVPLVALQRFLQDAVVS